MPTRTQASPKRRTVGGPGRSGAYPYYAGFAYEWAVAELQELDLESGSLVLDPWNGAGTTTVAASVLGFRSVGVDLNPVAVIAAKARITPPESIDLLLELRPEASGAEHATPMGAAWLSSSSARAVSAVHHSLLQQVDALTSAYEVRDSLDSCVKVVTFSALRRLTSRFQGTNPTWVRSPPPRNRARPNEEAVVQAFRLEIEALHRALGEDPLQLGEHRSLLVQASSRALPLADCSVDAVVTSPPYCTRIDYAIATARELSVLKYTARDIQELRLQLLGSTANCAGQPPQPSLGPQGLQLLEAIRGHESRDAGGYYYKNFAQYFDALDASVQELSRVLKIGGRMVAVVQDSYFYDVQIPLADILKETCTKHGIALSGSRSVPVKRNLVTMNTRARQSRLDAQVSEHVLRFRKEN